MRDRELRHRPRRCRVRPAAWAVLVLVAASCSPGHASVATTTTASTAASTTTSTTTLAQLKETIVERWKAAQMASLAVARDPTSSALMLVLSNYFANPQLTFLRTQYAHYAGDGLKTIGNLDLGAPQVVSLKATEAVVQSCETDALAIVFAATGKPLPGKMGDPTPTPAGVRANMTMGSDGLWYLSNTGGKEGSCAGY